MTGLIADIKRFAVHDGPGIRTTVFVKGCPLQCLWCHNPENMGYTPVMAHTPALCIGCGACADACPNNLITITQAYRIDRAQCVGCGQCARACLPGALKRYGEEYEPLTLANILKEDIDFFTASGGGVTFSGGEPLTQAAFCAETLALSKAERIHTAIDTCGDVPFDAFESVMPYTDLFLYDIKHTDSDTHARWTGRPNTRILENLRHIDRLGARWEVRIPIIPGVNSNADALDAIGRFLASLKGGHPVRLLPYHHMSAGKYRAVGMEYAMPETAPPTQDDMLAARARVSAAYGGLVLLPGE